MHQNAEISMRQHLENLGWHAKYLDDYGIYARVTIKNGASFLVPHSRLQRLLTRRRLPIKEVTPLGMRIKFLKSLKYEMCGPISIFSHPFGWFFFKILEFFLGEDPNTLPMFIGSLNERDQPNFDQFPFDEWLTVVELLKFEIMYKDSNDKIWTISNIPLTSVTQVEVSPQST